MPLALVSDQKFGTVNHLQDLGSTGHSNQSQHQQASKSGNRLWHTCFTNKKATDHTNNQESITPLGNGNHHQAIYGSPLKTTCFLHKQDVYTSNTTIIIDNTNHTHSQTSNQHVVSTKPSPRLISHLSMQFRLHKLAAGNTYLHYILVNPKY